MAQAAVSYPNKTPKPNKAQVNQGTVSRLPVDDKALIRDANVAAEAQRKVLAWSSAAGAQALDAATEAACKSAAKLKRPASTVAGIRAKLEVLKLHGAAPAPGAKQDLASCFRDNSGFAYDDAIMGVLNSALADVDRLLSGETPLAALANAAESEPGAMPEVSGRCIVAALGPKLLEVLPGIESRETEEAAYDAIDAIRDDIERCPAVTIGGALLQIANALSRLQQVNTDPLPDAEWRDWEVADRTMRNAFATINGVLGFPFNDRLGEFFGVGGYALVRGERRAAFDIAERERGPVGPSVSEMAELAKFVSGLSDPQLSELTAVTREYGGTPEFPAQIEALKTKWLRETGPDAEIFRLGAIVEDGIRQSFAEQEKTKAGEEPAATEDERIDAVENLLGYRDALDRAIVFKPKTMPGAIEQVRIAKISALLDGSYVDSAFIPAMDNLLSVSGADTSLYALGQFPQAAE